MILPENVCDLMNEDVFLSTGWQCDAPEQHIKHMCE
jgi:hypothetical protein